MSDPGALVQFLCDCCAQIIEAAEAELRGRFTWPCPNCHWPADTPKQFHPKPDTWEPPGGRLRPEVDDGR